MSRPSPVRVHFHEMEHDQALIDQIESRVDKLTKTGEPILGCTVSIAAVSHRSQPIYRVHAKVATPHGDVVASKDEEHHHDHTLAHNAVRDAMDALHRQMLQRRKRLIGRRQSA